MTTGTFHVFGTAALAAAVRERCWQRTLAWATTWPALGSARAHAARTGTLVVDRGVLATLTTVGSAAARAATDPLTRPSVVHALRGVGLARGFRGAVVVDDGRGAVDPRHTIAALARRAAPLRSATFRDAEGVVMLVRVTPTDDGHLSIDVRDGSDALVVALEVGATCWESAVCRQRVVRAIRDARPHDARIQVAATALAAQLEGVA